MKGARGIASLSIGAKPKPLSAPSYFFTIKPIGVVA